MKMESFILAQQKLHGIDELQSMLNQIDYLEKYNYRNVEFYKERWLRTHFFRILIPDDIYQCVLSTMKKEIQIRIDKLRQEFEEIN